MRTWPVACWVIGVVLLGQSACSSPSATSPVPGAAANATPGSSTPPAASGTAPAPPGSNARTQVTVSYSQVTGNEIPLWVAQEAGIFEQNGLAPDLQLIEGNKGIAALLSGIPPLPPTSISIHQENRPSNTSVVHFYVTFTLLTTE